VIAVDTNLLVAFVRTEYPHHEMAQARIRDLAQGPAAWAVPWACVHEFLAVTTSPRIFRTPLSTAQAAETIEALQESPTLRLIAEGPGYWDTLRSLIIAGNVAGGKIHDARIAAVCLTHGVAELWTADRDFGRFPALRVRNPCA
jgi:toxin-antitoxin system PIN domain toxin